MRTSLALGAAAFLGLTGCNTHQGLVDTKAAVLQARIEAGEVDVAEAAQFLDEISCEQAMIDRTGGIAVDEMSHRKHCGDLGVTYILETQEGLRYAYGQLVMESLTSAQETER